MVRSIALTVLLLVFLAPPAIGQAQDGHVYNVAQWDAKTGHEAAYSQSYRDYLMPVFNELKQRGAIVSYLALSKNTGSPHSTHLVVIEFANWAALDGFQQKIDEASRAVHGKPFPEIVAEHFVPHRDPGGSDIYVAP
jgi:hypothetical protein